MKIQKLLLGALVLLCFAEPAMAQQPETQILEEFASPGVEGQGRSRGLVIGYERLPHFDIDSESDDNRIGDGSSRVKRNNKFDFKVFAPVVNRPQTKVIAGFGYNLEEFNFSNENPLRYPIYQYLEDKNLKSISLQLAYLHSLNARNFYLVRVKGELNGDYTHNNISITDFLKATVDLAYGWKKNPNYAIGVGVQMGYTFGRQSIYPGLLYNRTFNEKWGVESIFPANARVRYNVNEKTLLYAGYRLEGASYNLYVDQPPLSEFKELELRRTDIKALLRLEREIYDFLWFSVEGGFRQYYRNRLYDEIGSRDPLVVNDLAGAGYIGVELYLVPPRSWVD